LLALLMGPQVITVAYKSGKFDAVSVALTTAVFNIYAVGMVFYALEIIALQVYYAHRDTRTPFYIGLLASLLQIWVAWTMGIRAGLGSIGIAMGYAIAKTVKVGFMCHYLQPKLSAIDWPAQKRMLVKTAICCAVLATVVLVSRGMVSQVHAIDLAKRKWALVYVGGVGLVSLGAYFATALVLGMDEARPLVLKIVGKLRRRGAQHGG
jgi:putative peptidoglycan lipid II flippase